MKIRQFVFKMRGFIPIPFTLIALIWAECLLIPVIIGGILTILGELLRIQALRHAGGATRTRKVGASKLVTSGPFGHMRNPLYTANIMLYVGYSLASGAFFPYLPLFALILFIVEYSLIISLEEETLIKLFGDEYIQYCKKVPRLLPKLSSSGAGNPDFSLKEALRQERSTLLAILTTWLLLVVRFLLVDFL